MKISILSHCLTNHRKKWTCF